MGVVFIVWIRQLVGRRIRVGSCGVYFEELGRWDGVSHHLLLLDMVGLLLSFYLFLLPRNKPHFLLGKFLKETGGGTAIQNC